MNFEILAHCALQALLEIYFLGHCEKEANMVVDKGAPKQHNQPSRKGKKAWRKNVDIEEVENGIGEVREEIIRGYEILSIAMLNSSKIPSKAARVAW